MSCRVCRGAESGPSLSGLLGPSLDLAAAVMGQARTVEHYSAAREACQIRAWSRLQLIQFLVSFDMTWLEAPQCAQQ